MTSAQLPSLKVPGRFITGAVGCGNNTTRGGGEAWAGGGGRGGVQFSNATR